MTFAQNRQKIFVQSERYDQITKEKIKKDDRFEDIIIAYTIHMDPAKSNDVDLVAFQKYLNRVFPNKEQGGYLCLDLENKIYSDLRNYNAESKEFLRAEKKFMSLLTTVKELRPNLKVGFYGLPYKIVSEKDSFSSVNNKLINILQKSDVLFPSLYLSYSEGQNNGKKRNDALIINNLQNSLFVGLKYKKKVIPFSWYRVHPSNKLYGGSILTSAQMKSYLSGILEYKYQNKSVYGIVYWEPNTNSFRSYKNLISNKKIESPSTLFRYYWYDEGL